MKCEQNESKLDKKVRLVVGGVSVFVGYFFLSGTFQTIAFVVGAISIFTGLTGFCLLYKIFGFKTNK